jgi:predicted Zn-dependent protease
MKEKILKTLHDLRDYAVAKKVDASFIYHEEDSYLMRFANSSISLNTNEHLIRLEITAYQDRQKATYELITNLDALDEMKKGVDIAAEMVKHAMPVNYQPTMPHFTQSFEDESAYDPALAALTNAERLAYFNEAAKGLETDEIKMSGIFSSGVNTLAQINTFTDHTQYFKTTDAQISVVLAHATNKWEIQAEQSAQKKSELDPKPLQRDLAYLLHHYTHDPSVQLPVGTYDIVFGPAAVAEFVGPLNFIAFDGGLLKRGYSFLTEEQVGKKVLSDKFNLTDDPTHPETFPFKRDFMGMERRPYPLFDKGVFKGFVWEQDDADEFGAKATGHTVMHKSLILNAGSEPVSTLQELVESKRDNDILYFPFLHYINYVNPSKGLITGSSRFGALLLKKDGSVVVPFNVRITQSLLDLFGDKVAWMSKSQTVYNTSMSYGSRNPTSIVVPTFMRVNGIEISHSNPSF